MNTKIATTETRRKRALALHRKYHSIREIFDAVGGRCLRFAHSSYKLHVTGMEGSTVRSDASSQNKLDTGSKR